MPRRGNLNKRRLAGTTAEPFWKRSRRRGVARRKYAGGAAVEKYLAARQAPYIMAEGGGHAAAPKPCVRSLDEAGRLAQELFRKNV